eukprot:1196013-Prorocentrum_minimum.AAC.9
MVLIHACNLAARLVVCNLNACHIQQLTFQEHVSGEGEHLGAEPSRAAAARPQVGLGVQAVAEGNDRDAWTSSDDDEGDA